MANRGQARRALHEILSREARTSEVRISKEEQWVGTVARAAADLYPDKLFRKTAKASPSNSAMAVQQPRRAQRK